MIIYHGKAKEMTYKTLLWLVYFQLTRRLERLEPEDFNQVRN